MRGKTFIIQGGQYGSEGKGQVAAVVAEQEKVAAAVRTGSINAGHTVYYKGKKFSMQILPTAWVVPGVTLVLGAGCYVHPEILKKEIDFVSEALGEDVRKRLLVDRRCVWFGTAEEKASKEANRHHAMGATGKGCSEAIITKMRDRGDVRNAHMRLVSTWAKSLEVETGDTTTFLHQLLESGGHVLLEGTQGSLLDFNLGEYPYVTSRMTNAAAWLAEAGLPPVNVETVLVVRSHPIRVAGNSGPLISEISWPILAREMNEKLDRLGKLPIVPEDVIQTFENALVKTYSERYPDAYRALGIAKILNPGLWTDAEKLEFRVARSEADAETLKLLAETYGADYLDNLTFFEKTTVTKKIRRIGRLNVSDLLDACRWNAPTRIAYTFLNYDFPELTNETDSYAIGYTAGGHLTNLERALGVPVHYVTTGPLNEHVINLYKS